MATVKQVAICFFYKYQYPFNEAVYFPFDYTARTLHVFMSKKS